MSEPLDLEKIMAEHADHGEGVWCGATPSVVDEQDPDPDNCLPYRLAAELARRDPVAYLTAAGEDLGLFDEDEPA